MNLPNWYYITPEGLLLFPLIIIGVVVLYFFIILLCIVSISHKLWDIRDSLEKISKNSWN